MDPSVPNNCRYRFLNNDVFQNSPKSNKLFGLLLKENLSHDNIHIKPIWSHCTQVRNLHVHHFVRMAFPHWSQIFILYSQRLRSTKSSFVTNFKGDGKILLRGLMLQILFCYMMLSPIEMLCSKLAFLLFRGFKIPRYCCTYQ